MCNADKKVDRGIWQEWSRFDQTREDFSLMVHLRSHALVIVVLIVMANVSAQMILFRPCLNDEVMCANVPTAVDAIGYLGLAKAVAAGEHFGSVFRGGERPPGYPFFLAFFVRFFVRPLLAARMMQIILSASVIFLSFLTVRRLTSRPDAALLTALLVSVWAPIYYLLPSFVGGDLLHFYAFRSSLPNILCRAEELSHDSGAMRHSSRSVNLSETKPDHASVPSGRCSIRGITQTAPAFHVRWHYSLEYGNDALAVGTFYECPLRSVSRSTLDFTR